MADSAEPAAQATFSIIGADGNTYGPVDFLTLREWAKDGRVLRNTMVIEHATGHQSPAGDIAGLFDGVLPPPMGEPGMGEAPPKKKGMSGLTIAALVVGVSCCLCVPVFAAILFPVFAQAGIAAKKTASLSNLKQLSLSVIMYTSDFDDRYPPHMESAAAMQPLVYPYVKSEMVFVSPNPKGGEYLGNPKLNGRNAMKVVDPSRTIMLYDSQPWPNNVALEAFADGHATSRDPFDKMLSDLQTDPFK